MKRIAILSILTCLLVINCVESTKNIDYTNFRKRGNTQAIVIADENRNMEDLKKLGLQLNKEQKNNSFSIILVFDNNEAARLFFVDGDLTEEQEKLFENHYLAMYSKNTTTRINEFDILLPDEEGGKFKIRY